MQARKFLHLTILAMPVLACQAGRADYYSNEQEYLQSFPIVLSASRLLQPASEAPNAMTVIDRDLIRASGFRKLPDIFKLVPGMYVSYYKGSEAIVSYHGSLSQDAQGMQVQIDGQSVFLPPYNTVDWASLPITLDDVERVEVIRGPAAASYGENSVHVVINIITRDAGTGRPEISLTRGGKGISDLSAHFGDRTGKLDYRISLGYTADNGYDNLTTLPNNMPLTTETEKSLNNSNDSNQARLLNLRATWHPTLRDDLDFKLGFNHDIRGVGFSDSHGGLNPFHDMISYANSQQLGWLHHADNNSEISLRYTHIQHDTDEYFSLGDVPVSHAIKSGRHEIELQHTLQATEGNRLIYGAGYREDQVNVNIRLPLVDPGDFSKLSNTSEFKIFLNDEWRASPELLINAGGMLENDAMAYRNFSPRVSLNYHLSPRHSLRLGYSVAYRTPALAEQLGATLIPEFGTPSPGLRPERLASREIGFMGEYQEIDTTLDLRLYHDRLDDGIYPEDDYWKNGMTGAYAGIEAAIRHSFANHSSLMANLAHQVAHSNIASLMPGEPDRLANSIPRNSISLLYSKQLPGDCSFSASWYLQTALQPFDRGPNDFQPAQHRVDMQLTKAFKNWEGLNGEISAVVQNLFGTDYTEYVNTALFNRRAYVTLLLH